MNIEGICETGSTVYSPYLRKLEKSNYKGRTFSLLVLKGLGHAILGNFV